MEANNFSKDFLEYDYAENIIKTIKTGSYFLGDGEYNTMPFYYITRVQKKDSAGRFITSLYLNYNWGIEDFKKASGLDAGMQPGQMRQNVMNLIAALAPSGSIYRSNVYHVLDNVNVPFTQRQDGVTVKIGGGEEPYFPVFKLYSYRGIYEKFVQKKRYYTYFITQYPVAMVNQANALAETGYNNEALYLYRKSLAFPVKVSTPHIYYNMSIAYRNLNDTENERACLLKSIQLGGRIMPVYERLAAILYEKAQYNGALSAAEEAYKNGSRDPLIISILRSAQGR